MFLVLYFFSRVKFLFIVIIEFLFLVKFLFLFLFIYMFTLWYFEKKISPLIILIKKFNFRAPDEYHQRLGRIRLQSHLLHWGGWDPMDPSERNINFKKKNVFFFCFSKKWIFFIFSKCVDVIALLSICFGFIFSF